MFERDLALAHLLADEADAITMRNFGSQTLSVWDKPDHTPVSEADQAAEEAMRTQLRLARPLDGIVGEEFGASELAHDFTSGEVVDNSDFTVSEVAKNADGIAGRRWILDPIDGTKNYVRGVPVWATLIGLARGLEVIVGVVSAPALGRRWWAMKGGGAWVGSAGIAHGEERRRIHVSSIDSLPEASLSYASLRGWGPQRTAFLDLMDSCWRTRAYGDFWSYMLVAEGAVDLTAEPELELYDMAALVPIVTEAGGQFTDLDGNQGPWGRGAIASNGLLHNAALSYLRA